MYDLYLMRKNAELKALTTSLILMRLNRSLLTLFAIAGLMPPIVFRVWGWMKGHALNSLGAFTYTLFTSVVSTVLVSIGVVTVINWLQRHFPWQQSIWKRAILEILLTTLTAFGLITLLVLIFHLLRPKADLQSAMLTHLVIAAVMNAALVAITEGIFFFRQWKQSTIETERFKKESIRAQFESLKNQVNPHFLFNSLNTLSHMIDTDTQQSKVFLDNLAQIYRYVLQHKDEEVVTLESELEFIRAFTQLLKHRHGDRVSFHFNISKENLKKGIPPMTLQLLVENAVKHNIASRKKPLKVELFDKPGYLSVRNNLQLKKNVPSTGIGLENVKKRYRFLVEQDINIHKTDHIFEVSIPLVKLS